MIIKLTCIEVTCRDEINTRSPDVKEVLNIESNTLALEVPIHFHEFHRVI